MSISIMSEVWKDAPIAGTELLMLLALADSANDDRECWPSLAHLQRKTRLSRPQTQRLLKSLERNGLIEILKNQGKGAAGRKTNQYRILDMTGITHDTPIQEGTGITHDTPTGITHDTQNHHIEPSEERDSISPSDEDEMQSAPKVKKPRAANPMYNAINKVWGYQGQRNGLMAGVLKGTATRKGWAEYNLETPITPEELIAWANWYRRVELKGRTDLNIIEAPVKVQSSIMQWQSLRAEKQNQPARRDLGSYEPPRDAWDNFRNKGDLTPDFLRDDEEAQS